MVEERHVDAGEDDCGFDGLTPKAKADVLDIRKEMEGGKPSSTTKRRWAPDSSKKPYSIGFFAIDGGNPSLSASQS